MRALLSLAGLALAASLSAQNVAAGFTFNAGIGATSRGALQQNAGQLLFRFDNEDYRGWGDSNATTNTVTGMQFILQDQFDSTVEQYDVRIYGEDLTTPNPNFPNFAVNAPAGTNELLHVGPFNSPGGVANAPAAEYFIDRYGLERVTASYDLNIAQLEALLASAPPDWFEITIHQHMPMFHMEHCVFCAFLSSGTDYTNCGRPCDRHDVRLRDRVGAQHPLRADAGCRNTVFNALAQTGAEYASRMLALGARTFRVEFLDETPEQVAQTVAKYRQLLRGEISGTQLWRELKLLNQLGVTRGQMR